MNTASTSGSAYGQFIVVLLIFVGVLALTYFVTRWVAGYQKGRGSGSNIQLIESAPLGNNKYIQIVRVGEKYVALAVCKDSVALLTELTMDEINLEEKGEAINSNISFKEIMTRAKSFSEKDENE